MPRAPFAKAARELVLKSVFDCAQRGRGYGRLVIHTEPPVL